MGFGPGGARPGGPGGPDSLGLAKSALEAAWKTGKFGKQLLGDEEAARGGTGEGTESSTSDYLRSLLGPAQGSEIGRLPNGALATGSIGGGPATALPVGTLGESLGFAGVSDEAIMNILDASGLGAEGIQGLLGEMNIPQGASGIGSAGEADECSGPAGQSDAAVMPQRGR